MNGIHFRPLGTIEIFREIVHVAQRDNHSVLVGRVLVGNDQLTQFLVPGHGAPNAGGRQPEHLASVVLDARQVSLFSVTLYPFAVRQVRFLYAADIGYVFSLGVYSVQLEEEGLAGVSFVPCGMR